MSNQDRLLSDEELSGQVFALLTNYIDSTAQAENAALAIGAMFNTQKRLYAESVLDKVIVQIEKNIKASESNLKYAKEHNNSDRTIANWKGCIEGEKFVKDDVIRLRAEQRARIK